MYNWTNRVTHTFISSASQSPWFYFKTKKSRILIEAPELDDRYTEDVDSRLFFYYRSRYIYVFMFLGNTGNAMYRLGNDL